MEEKKESTVSRFEHDKVMMHYNWVNRRSMICLISVCITMIIIVLIFATNQTKREQMWQDTIKELYRSTVTEVADGQNTDTAQ